MGIDARMVLRGINAATTTDETIKRWSWDLVATFGSEPFCLNPDTGAAAIRKTEDYSYEGDNLPPGKIYHQDGPSIEAAPNEVLLEVKLAGRYYGIGYERGSILFYCEIAAWCEKNIPGCQVWYGGDSSGVCLERFDMDLRQKLFDHFISPHGKDYYRRKPENALRPAPCALCVPGREMSQFGWGGGGTFMALHCPGCARSFETRDSGETWTLRE